VVVVRAGDDVVVAPAVVGAPRGRSPARGTELHPPAASPIAANPAVTLDAAVLRYRFSRKGTKLYEPSAREAGAARRGTCRTAAVRIPPVLQMKSGAAFRPPSVLSSRPPFDGASICAAWLKPSCITANA